MKEFFFFTFVIGHQTDQQKDDQKSAKIQNTIWREEICERPFIVVCIKG